VPRYYFHFSDGKRQFADTSGHELRGVAAARAHAIWHVRELKAAMCQPQVQDLSGWTMTVADAKGRTVFEIGFDLRPLPVREHI
jgi:phage gp16-like protein